ncbi:hypothetical protein F5877DRAFT_86423 [Lentinula edodes]|nr:hypothetical protein F5877DRAFT_86423 [Lentinula edodes]
MSSTPAHPISRTTSPLLPTLTALGEVPSLDPEYNGEVETDQLAFILESLSRPQLQLFEMVFNTGKPLSGYCQDDPLWPLLAEGIPLSTWRQYDAALYAHTSSTSTLLELDMLDEQDTADADQQELWKFLALQQGEAVVVSATIPLCLWLLGLMTNSNPDTLMRGKC